MYKVSFIYFGQPKVLCCKKLEEGPMLFNTLMGIVRDPEKEAQQMQYKIRSNLLIGDSYDEFKDRKFVRIPVNAIVMIEQFDLQKLKNLKVIKDAVVEDLFS